jgi:hypothetical protein
MAQTVVTTRILRRLLKSGAHFRAEKLLERVHPADIGPILKDLTPDEIRIVIDLLFKHRRAARMLRELPPEILPEIIEAVSDERLAEVLSRLEIDDILICHAFAAGRYRHPHGAGIARAFGRQHHHDLHPRAQGGGRRHGQPAGCAGGGLKDRSSSA